MKTVIQFLPFLNDAGAENLIKNYCLFIDRKKFNFFVVTVFDYCNNCGVYRSIQNSGVPIISLYDQNWHKSNLRKRIESFGQNQNSQPMFLKRLWNRFFADRVTEYMQLRFEKKTGRKFSKIIKTLHPDVIHAHLHVQNYLRWANIAHAKLYYTCHSEPGRYFTGREYDSTKYLIDHCSMKIIALHHDMRNEINTLFHLDNTLVLNNWIDFSKYKNVNETQSAIRQSFKIPEDALVIGTVGRIVEYKNQIFLIDVLNDIIKTGKKAYLIIAGDGSCSLKNKIYSKAKQYQIDKNVIMLGVRDDTERIYKAMDVFMLPSLFEGLGMVAVEAQVAGLRCLLSDRVPSSVCLSDKTFFLPLDNSKIWAEYALSDTKSDREYGDIKDYDICLGIKELERLYGESCEI